MSTVGLLEPLLSWRRPCPKQRRRSWGNCPPLKDPPLQRVLTRIARVSMAHPRHAGTQADMTSNHTPIDAKDAFAQLGRIVLGEQPLESVLDQVVRIARQVLPVPTEASITLIAGDEPSTVAYTNDTALALDERQYEAERGPCLDSAASGTLILIPDMTQDER